jgi:hypothetical protein
MGFRIDGAAGTLVDIIAYINSQEIDRAVDLMEDTGMSATNKSYLAGLAGTTLNIGGFVNTTTDAIFGPLISTNTSITKTVEYKAHTARFYNGEVWVTNVKYSGSPNNLEVFSASVTFDDAVNRTSVALA